MNAGDGDDDRTALRALYRAPEAQVLAPLLDAATLAPEIAARIASRARALVRAARAAHRPGADMADLLNEYGLDTREGVALLCLAEALLRIPDTATADALIEDRFSTADWETHLGHADNLMVNASSWAFMLTGRVMALDDADGGGFSGVIRRMVRRVGEPLILSALRQGMRVLARQFVMGRTIEEALSRAGTGTARRWRYSFDMLGEAARTRADAERYMRAYQDAIGVGWTNRRRTGIGAGDFGEAVRVAPPLRTAPGGTLRAGPDHGSHRTWRERRRTATSG
jgi:RHH-type proline utilization regulon transcriptional repressor/proline dehydrogenase/delta 1-pyrroline-5-carboxylate dehydrogenase